MQLHRWPVASCCSCIANQLQRVAAASQTSCNVLQLQRGTFSACCSCSVNQSQLQRWSGCSCATIGGISPATLPCFPPPTNKIIPRRRERITQLYLPDHMAPEKVVGLYFLNPQHYLNCNWSDLNRARGLAAQVEPRSFSTTLNGGFLQFEWNISLALIKGTYVLFLTVNT